MDWLLEPPAWFTWASGVVFVVTYLRAAWIRSAPNSRRDRVRRLNKFTAEIEAAFTRLSLGISEAGSVNSLPIVVISAETGVGHEPSDFLPGESGVPVRGAIVAPAGAGKSSFLAKIGLATVRSPRETLNDYEDMVESFVWPVMISLSKWPGHTSLAGFVRGELLEQYALKPDIVDRLLDEDALYLLLDGLDEMGSENLRMDALGAIETYLEIHPASSLLLSARTGQGIPDDFPTYRTEPLTESEVAAYLDGAGRPGEAVREHYLRATETARSVLSRPLFLDLAVVLVERAPDRQMPMFGLSDPAAVERALVSEYLDATLSTEHGGRSARAAATWLAVKLRELGLGATFTVTSMDPRWLPRAGDTITAFALMGAVVAVPFSGAAAVVAAARGGPVWALPLILGAGTVLGLLYSLAPRVMYSTRRRRRTPQAVQRRTWSLLRLLVEIRYRRRAIAQRLAVNTVAGTCLGLVFAWIAPTPGSWPRGIVGGVVAWALIAIAVVAVGGALGGLLAGLAAISALHLASGLFWLDVCAGVLAGALSALIFAAADLGENMTVGEVTESPSRLFRMNLATQLRYETGLWGAYGVVYGLLAWQFFGDSRWMVYGAAVSVVGSAFYGLAGGVFPLLLFGLTSVGLQRRGIMDQPLDEALADLERIGVLRRTTGGLGLRFVHPLAVELLAAGT